MTKTKEDLSQTGGDEPVCAWPWIPGVGGNSCHSVWGLGHRLNTGSGLAMISFCYGPGKAIFIELWICVYCGYALKRQKQARVAWAFSVPG